MEHSLEMPLADVLECMQTRIFHNTRYFGIRTLKSPLDFWVYQEIFHELRPDYVIEIGNLFGGSTLALAHLCDALGHGKIIGLDCSHQEIPQWVRDHPRLTLIEGEATASVELVKKMVEKAKTVLVIEDSNHTYDNTLNILRTFGPLVTPGSYFIVEDGIICHGIKGEAVPWVYEAIETFMQEDDTFEMDRERENFLITWNPTGYLRKKLPAPATQPDPSGNNQA
jgi:cephalosporin hydroxylase